MSELSILKSFYAQNYRKNEDVIVFVDKKTPLFMKNLLLIIKEYPIFRGNKEIVSEKNNL